MDVFDQADLHLERVDWILSAAWRGAFQMTSQQDVDSAWLIVHGQQKRLILLRHGVPEVDRCITTGDDYWFPNVNDFVQSWQWRNQSYSSVQWLITAPSEARMQLSEWDRISLGTGSTELFQLMDYQPFEPQAPSRLLDPLASLGFIGLGLSR